MTAFGNPAAPFFFTSDGFGVEPKVYAGANGSKVYSGVAVFRSGTFRDSMGRQNTWEGVHIKQMVDNYDHLSEKGILASVPARDGHKDWLVSNIPGRGEVVGWHKDLKRKSLKNPIDGKQYSYILADYEITQAYALEKIQNGTWRNRSAEIGGYGTNDEAEFWPVYLGFAFVDFSAVEGLNFSSSQGARFYSYFEGSGTLRGEAVTDQTGQQGAPALPFPTNMTPPAQATQHTQAPVQPVAQPSAPFVFSIGGQNVTDPNAVQAYVNRMEQFTKDTRDTVRKNFVAGLKAANRITAPQEEGMAAFACGLTDEQYAQWSAMWDVAPVQPILGLHGGQAANANPTNHAQPDPEDQKIADAEAVVKMHATGGVMTEEQIKQTSAYKILVAAGKRPA